MTREDVANMREQAKLWGALGHPFISMIFIFGPFAVIAMSIAKYNGTISYIMAMFGLLLMGFVMLFLAPKKRKQCLEEADRIERSIEYQEEKERKEKIKNDKVEAEKRKIEESEKIRMEKMIIEKAKIKCVDSDFLNADMIEEISRLSNCAAIYSYFENIISDDQRYALLVDKLKNLKEVEKWYGNKKEAALDLIKEMVASVS